MRKKGSSNWLPIDQRLLPPLFHFGNLSGLARVFIFVEMLLASLVVVGTFIVVIESLLF